MADVRSAKLAEQGCFWDGGEITRQSMGDVCASFPHGHPV